MPRCAVDVIDLGGCVDLGGFWWIFMDFEGKIKALGLWTFDGL